MQPPAPEVSTRSTDSPASSRALAPVFFYSAIVGVTTVMLGPLLPELILHWHIQDAQAGTLFTATFAGQLCGACFAARRLRASVLYGAAITSAGCLAMIWATFNVAHIALFCVGLGGGAGLTAANILVGTVVPSARARLLALLNVVWSCGAIASPAIVSACGPAGLRTFFLIASALLGVAAVFAMMIPRSGNSQSEAFSSTAAVIPDAKPTRLRIPLTRLTLFAFAAAMLLFVGAENALGGWLPTYAVRINSSASFTNVAMYFWMAELAGRLLMAMPTNWFNEATLYRVSAAMLFFAVMLLLGLPHLASSGMIVLTILCGLTLAPLYPLIIAFLLARTGSHPSLGPLFATASLGGATLPWFTGIMSTHFSSLRVGFAVPATAALLLLLLSVGITGKSTHTGEAGTRVEVVTP